MKKLIVKAHAADPKSYKIRIFSNHSATRDVRATEPDVVRLIPLAAWLVINVPTSYAGSGRSVTASRVLCWSGLTERERLIKSARTSSQQEKAEKFIRCYGASLDRLERIDWLFPVITPIETDEQFWNRAAQEIINAGVTRIAIQDIDGQTVASQEVSR